MSKPYAPICKVLEYEKSYTLEVSYVRPLNINRPSPGVNRDNFPSIIPRTARPIARHNPTDYIQKHLLGEIMSRSHRKSFRCTICMVALNTMRKWKRDSTQIRRSREKAALKKIDPQNAEETQEQCNIKYQRSKGLSDWSGPHDGYWFYQDAKQYASSQKKPWKITDK